MIEFGKTLREAREQKGLTTSQIAEQTHLLVQIVEDLEKEDFHRISAPIYGRGFIKLYCEAVGIEPKPLVDEFMSIISGERDPVIRVREVALPTAAADPVEPAQPPAAPAPVCTQPELGDAGTESGQDARQETRDASGDIGRETRAGTLDAGREAPDARLETPRQYHPDIARATPQLPPNLGRLAVLAAGTLLVLIVLVWSGRALYRLSMGIGDESPSATAEVAPMPQPETAEKERKPAGNDAKKKATGAKPKATSAKPKATDAKPKAKSTRTPKPVKPLYID